MNKRLFFFILTLILLAGFYLRIGGVLSLSFAFTYDVGRDMLELAKISKFDIPLIGPTTGLAGLYYGPWWYYILTPSFLISKGSPQGVAFFMTLTGLASIILGYFFGKLISGRYLGLIMASFISVSAVMVSISNQVWNPNIIPPFVLVSFILLLKIKEKKDYSKSILLGFMLGLIFDAEIVFGALFLTGFGISYILIFKKKSLTLNTLPLFLGVILTLSPRLLFEVRHGFVMTKSFFIDKGESQRILDFMSFLFVLPERMNAIINQVGDTFGVNTIFSLFIILGAIAVRITLRKKIKNEEKIVIDTSIVMIASFVIGSSFFARAVWGHYIVGLPTLYIIVVSLTIIFLSRKYLLISILVFLILIIVSTKPMQLWGNFMNPNWEGDAAVYRNQIAVIDYIYKNAASKKFNYLVYTPPVHDYTYRYLFSWYGESRYNHIPEKEAQDLLFVIIESDPGHEERIVDWLKIREGDGKVVEEQLVKGGIKVQTRIR